MDKEREIRKIAEKLYASEPSEVGDLLKKLFDFFR